MEALEIREARRRLGLSQAMLSRLVGVSQPMISNIERGFRAPGPALHRKLEEALLESRAATDRSSPSRPRDEKPPLPLARAAHKALLPGGRPAVVVDRWMRPSDSGDAQAVISLGENGLLVAGIDVAGHGSRLLPQAQYLLGWLSGRCRALGGVPSLPSLASDLQDELEATNLRAGFFLATLEALGDGVRDVLYTALAYAFPPPLLITSPPYRSHTAIAEHDRSAATLYVPHQIQLEAPWRLVLSSDGLLARLGGGSESAGRRKLVRWQRGMECEAPLESFLETQADLTDDESALVIRSSAWDEVLEIDVDDTASRHRALRTVQRNAGRALDEKAACEVAQAVLEALTNVRDRAYDGHGAATLRTLRGTRTFRVEIEDEGRDQITPHTVESSQGGFLIMQRCAGNLNVRRNYPRGTIVTLVFPMPEPGR